MTEILTETKITIIAQKLALWHNTYYSDELDAKIAKAIDDGPMLERAKINMKRALQVIDQLEEALAELDQLADG